jgi:hypothetical protein
VSGTSVKWRENQPFDLRDYKTLLRDVQSVPGVSDETALLAVTRDGQTTDEVPIRCLSPEALLAAYS